MSQVEHSWACRTLFKDRGYVVKESKALRVESLGRVLSAFLATYFQRYVDFGFTSSIEDQLDQVSAGEMHWQQLLQQFWGPFQTQVNQVEQVATRVIIDEIDKLLAPHLFPTQDGQSEEEARGCPLCHSRLQLKPSRNGGFIGCSNYPDCRYARPLAILSQDAAQESAAEYSEEGVSLGVHPDTKQEIRVRRGQYGLYLEMDRESGKPTRLSLPGNVLNDPAFGLEAAVKLLQWPKALGTDTKTGKEIEVAVGKFGPYVKCEKVYASLQKGVDPDTVTLEEAIELLQKKRDSPRYKARLQQKQAKKATKESKPLTGYQYFCKLKRQEYKEAKLDLQPTEIMRKLGESWRRLTEAEKAEWAQKSDKDNAMSQPKSSPAPRGDTGAKSTGSIGRQQTGYLAFGSEKRQELKAAGTDLKQSEIMSLIATEWRELGQDGKLQWNQRAATSSDAEQSKSVLGLSNGAKRNSQSTSDVSKGSKRPGNGYIEYSKSRRNDLKAEQPALTPTEVMKVLGKEWRELPSEQKLEYTELART